MSRHLTYLLPFDFFTSYFGGVVIILVDRSTLHLLSCTPVL